MILEVFSNLGFYDSMKSGDLFKCLGKVPAEALWSKAGACSTRKALLPSFISVLSCDWKYLCGAQK